MSQIFHKYIGCVLVSRVSYAIRVLYLSDLAVLTALTLIQDVEQGRFFFFFYLVLGVCV